MIMAASYIHIKSRDLSPDENPEGDKIFEEIYEKYFNTISSFCYKLIDQQEEAHDIATDTFIKLYCKLDSLHSEENIRAFLYVTSRNACMDYFRWQKKKQALRAEIKRSQDTEEYVRLNKELDLLYQQAIHKAFEQLPERQKEVIEKLYREGKDFQTIAREMDIQVRTAHNLRLRAVSSMKEYVSHIITEGIILFLIISTIYQRP